MHPDTPSPLYSQRATAAFRQGIGLAVLESYFDDVKVALDAGQQGRAADARLELGLTKMQIALMNGHPDGHLDIDPHRQLVAEATEDVGAALGIGLADEAKAARADRLLHFLNVWHTLNNRYETFKWPLLSKEECNKLLSLVTAGEYDNLMESIDGNAYVAYQYQIVGHRSHTSLPQVHSPRHQT